MGLQSTEGGMLYYFESELLATKRVLVKVKAGL